jgi:limonene-1,2-epoxide hydrolase
MNSQSTRRELLIGSGLALLWAATSVQPAGAKTTDSIGLSELEKANVKLVREFLASWNKPDLDIDKLTAQYIAPNAPIRWFDDEPVAFGPEAAAVAAKRAAGNSVRMETKILEVLARGPLVATSRVDTIKIPGQPDESFKTAGVCIVKDGKFHEYCDYIVT